MGQGSSKKAEPDPAPKLNKGQATITLTDKDRAVLDLKLVASDVKRFQKNLDKSCDELMIRAKSMVAANPSAEPRALGLLKLRRYKMEQSAKLDDQLANVLRTIDQMEWAEINKEVITNLKAGTQALKAMNEAMPIEEVERIMGECQDAYEAERQIGEALGLGGGGLGAQDEDLAALERELAAFVPPGKAAEQLPLPPVPSTPVLPLPVPVDRPVHAGRQPQAEAEDGRERGQIAAAT